MQSRCCPCHTAAKRDYSEPFGRPRPRVQQCARCPGHGGRVESETVATNNPALEMAPPTKASDIAGAYASAGRSCSAAWHCPARRLSHVPRLALASTSVSASETSRPSLNCRSVTRHTMARPFRSANIRKCRGARVGATTHAFTCTRTCCCARPHLHAQARPHGPSGAKCGQIFFLLAPPQTLHCARALWSSSRYWPLVSLRCSRVA